MQCVLSAFRTEFADFQSDRIAAFLGGVVVARTTFCADQGNFFSAHFGTSLLVK